MRSDSNRIPSEVPLINFDCKNLNHFGSTGKNLNYVLLVQEIKFNSKKYWAVHGDEWGANFLVDKKMVEPIDFEDVIFTEKINIEPQLLLLLKLLFLVQNRARKGGLSGSLRTFR